MTTKTSANAWEDALIAEWRANDGHVTSGPLAGHPLLLMTSTGARSGEPRRAILTYARDGDAYLVAGTAGGSQTDPAWVRNVEANPQVTLEVGNTSFAATAGVHLDGAERDRLWDIQVRTNPWFGEYPAKVGRTIPMVRLTRTDG